MNRPSREVTSDHCNRVIVKIPQKTENLLIERREPNRISADLVHSPMPPDWWQNFRGWGIVFDRWGRCLVAWLAVCSLLVSSTAAIVHTHEHADHSHANCSAHVKPVTHHHAGCKHHHYHSKPVSKSDAPSHQHPALPHSRDDCSLCHFLLEHPLPPSIVELPLLDMVLELRPETPRIIAVSARFDVPPARGPPCQA